jgi:dCTP deaminase
MILSDKSIIRAVTQEEITITGFNEKNLGPNSYDVTLADDIRMYDLDDNRNYTILDYHPLTGKQDVKIFCLDVTQRTDLAKIKKGTKNEVEGYYLFPGILYIAATNEKIGTDKYVQELHGRSSMARLGLTVHSAAGYGDVGFNGTWTLELSVIHPLFIVPNMKIAQVQFSMIDQIPLKLYKDKHSGAKYNNQSDPRGYIPDPEIMSREIKRIYKDD